MFASLPIERELLTFKDLLPGFLYWVEAVGGYATVGLVLWFILGLTLMKRKDRQRIPSWMASAFVAASAAAVFCYGVYVIALYVKPPAPLEFTTEGVPIPRKGIDWHDVIGVVGGCCALFAVLLPVVRGLGRLSARRIWALSRLSFKEAIRRRVLWVFSILIVVFLFASWFIPAKPEHQVSTYIGVVDYVMTFLLLLSAVLLASFSIPNDIKQQTIHTILTKPVERFEIVLGRFLGYAALLSLVLVVMTGFSLLYLVWEVDPDAAAESLKARDPLWGELHFKDTGNENKGINVGKEWDYRSYIAYPMPGQQGGTAIWDFDSVGAALANRNAVRCEYTFDVFRSTKGYENKGVNVKLVFRTWHSKPGNENGQDYLAELDRRGRTEHGSEADLKNELSEKYGYYEVPSTAVSSGHTYGLDLPAGLFKSINAGPDEQRKREADATKRPLPALEVRVQCISPTQYVGMAKHDFWLRQDDPGAGHDKLWFAYNFFKAQAVDLWLKLLLVTGVSVALSTYLSGVISLLVALVLYFGGIILNFIQSVAFGKNYGGGPFQSLLALANRRLSGQETGSNDSVTKVIFASDEVVRFGFRRVVDLFPDVSRFDFTRFVQEGFNIPAGQLVINFLLMAAYVLPWIVLSYYLMKWKEVASAT
jgi:ABC-type transport system involved in multi-copper enzyme maturation permease subunit